MRFDRCFGCMEQVTAYPCPKCGYDPKVQTLDYALRPGTILNGKYTVGRMLGQGGFGITYIGWDLALERKVAVKEYFPSGCVGRNGTTLHWYASQQAQAARESGMEMFLKEARKMALVDSIPGVVRVRDLFQENETAYIVMDFIEGQTLMARLREKGPLSWEEAKNIFLPAIRTMDRVHQAGLVHRDLSPDNLMLEPGGGVKILDLGAAKDLNINSGASSMQVAKRGFSPLEQYIQRGGSGPWTDVYAMAATMYYALTGVLPQAAVDRMDRDTLDWNLPRLRQLPGGALDALKKAMALRHEHRTPSMAALEQALFTAPTPQPEPRPAPQPAPQPKPQPHPSVQKTQEWGWIWVVASFLVILGVLLWLTRPTGQAETAPQAQARSATQSSGQTAAEPTQTTPSQADPLQWRSNVLRSYGIFDNYSVFDGIQRERVKTVTFLDTLANAPADSVDVSESQDGSVLLWAEANGELYDLYIAGEGGINGEAACEYLFAKCTNLQSVDFNQCFHTETTTSFQQMFYGCSSLTVLDLSGWDTSSVTDMYRMFYDCESLTDLDLSGWDTSSVTDMYGTFYSCESLKELDLSGWDTSSVTDMSRMFSGCSSLAELDLSGWDTSSVTDMGSMFSWCEALITLDLSGWDTSSVTDMGDVFCSCESLEDLDLSGWDTSSVTDMDSMFSWCKTLTELDLSGWDTSSVTDMSWMFYNCESLTDLDLSGWDVSSVTAYEYFMDDGKTINGRPWEEFFE